MLSAVLFSLVQFLCLSAGGALAAVSCYNDQGSPVDWFYLYKLPQLSHHAPGSGLLYLLLQQGNDSWVKGASLVNESDSALGRTVGQLYKLRQQEDLGYILYNDQKPPEQGGGGVSSECGHTKGVVLLDKTQGFWLVHSTPHFPPRQEVGEFSYPSTGMENGQNFLCMTFPLERFEAIGEQLQYNQPLVFDCSVPDALASQAPSLHQLCRRRYGAPAPRPANRSVSLPSLGGTTFLSFAKSRAFDDDLYVAWVAPSLRADLLVQFWQRSRGVRPSNCSLGYRVLNVEELAPGGSGSFRSTLDHSKWAASAGAGDEDGWVCVGDINRDEAEERRGGGTVCLRDGRVWRAYRAAVTGVQDCP